jgi:hypothetical protein
MASVYSDKHSIALSNNEDYPLYARHRAEVEQQSVVVSASKAKSKLFYLGKWIMKEEQYMEGLIKEFLVENLPPPILSEGCITQRDINLASMGRALRPTYLFLCFFSSILGHFYVTF